MTLIVAVYVPEGIVMASDSRQSITIEVKKPSGEAFKVETVNSDAVTKTFLLEKQQVGISNFGTDLLNGIPISSHIQSFLEEEVVAADDVTTIPKKLAGYFRKSFPDADAGFHVAGYKKENKISVPYVYYCHVAKNEVARFLKPGGIFYMVREHPFMTIFDDSMDATELTAVYPYLHNSEPTRWEWQGSYADGDARVLNPSYEWSHSLGDVINSLIKAGLRIEYVHEFPMICWQALPSMEEKKPGWWGLKGDRMIPLSFSLKAIKAA